jgi:hypothetical protein
MGDHVRQRCLVGQYQSALRPAQESTTCWAQVMSSSPAPNDLVTNNHPSIQEGKKATGPQ